MSSQGFNQFTGRLKNSANLQPLNPIQPVPLDPRSQQKMTYDSIRTKMAEIDKAYSGERKSTLCPKLAAKMKQFQPPGYMDIPVYLMGGTKDKILFGITVGLGVFGMASVFEFIYSAANKK